MTVIMAFSHYQMTQGFSSPLHFPCRFHTHRPMPSHVRHPSFTPKTPQASLRNSPLQCQLRKRHLCSQFLLTVRRDVHRASLPQELMDLNEAMPSLSLTLHASLSQCPPLTLLGNTYLHPLFSLINTNFLLAPNYQCAPNQESKETES